MTLISPPQLSLAAEYAFAEWYWRNRDVVDEATARALWAGAWEAAMSEALGPDGAVWVDGYREGYEDGRHSRPSRVDG